jgi:parvulin-like peptidyl-prolyl isomerase
MGNKRTKMIWWVLIAITVLTFLGGFVFLFGAGFDSSYRARASGAVGTVNGSPISRTDWQSALADQRETYKRQYGVDPGERDMMLVEVQTWRSLVAQRLLTMQAEKAGLEAHDAEVVLMLKTSPPNVLMTAPAFQTDGKFDPSKYQAALRDPNVNWAPFEDLVRHQLPMRKLQERMVSSIKLAEPELALAYRDRFERVDGTAVIVPPGAVAQGKMPSEAEIQKVYEQYKNRFVHGPRTQLEVLVQPRTYGPEETRVAKDLASSLTQRARRGENWASLVRDYSEGPSVNQGGVVERTLQVAEFGNEMAPKIAVMDTGGITDPVQDAGRFMIFKVLQKVDSTGAPAIRVAQLVVKVKANETQVHEQYQALQKIRSRATKIGLGKAAAEKGLTTINTGYFDYNNTPQALYGVPEAAEWGLNNPKGTVSPVFDGLDEMAVVQVVNQSPPGPSSREEMTDQLRQIASLEAAVDRSKARADSIARMVSSGATLDQAAAAAKIPPIKFQGATRAQPEPRLGGAPEVIGAVFGAKPGQVVGPIRTISGWYFIRVDSKTPADMTVFDQVKGQISGDMLQRRQQSFLNEYLNSIRQQAKVKDLRAEATSY